MGNGRIAPLLRLLDDTNEEVRKGVQKALLSYKGDASDDLAALGIDPKSPTGELLSKSLHPGRQSVIRSHWALPSRSLETPDGDWDSFESLLRLLSDYLHDGVTLRPSLSDSLDLLTEEARLEVQSPIELAAWLFGSGRFTGNKKDPYDPSNSDLAWVLSEGKSNPLGLSLIYLLVAQRLEMEVFGVNYPKHFLCLIGSEQGPMLIDPFHRGRPLSVRKLLADHPNLSREAKSAVASPATLATMLKRLLANMNLAFANNGRPSDAALMQELLKTFRYED